MTVADVAVAARGLCKIYRVYHNALSPFLGVIDGRKHYTERVALDRVDLELRRGEIVGVLGRNGAGKSTLLKIIAGTLDPTAGELAVRGRITAILELGTGFHSEYTGRENVYLGGLCLGMRRAEIEAKLEAIIDFSELREVIDQPFKTYSTGMQARLTFATAISVDPDILIVDEALSVGDARFQQKCFSWIKRLRENNATVLFVSHDTNTITTFCDRALILEKGEVYAEGDTKKITMLYHNLLFGQGKEAGSVVLQTRWNRSGAAAFAGEMANAAAPSGVAGGTPPTGALMRYGSREAELVDWGLYDNDGRKVSMVESGSRCRLSMILTCKVDIADLSVGFVIKDRRGTGVWGITNYSHFRAATRVVAGEVLTVTVPCTMWLAAGDYFITFGAAHREDGEKIDFIEDGLGFRVTGPGNIFGTSVVNLDSALIIDRANARSRELAEADKGEDR
jgi:lipopolysaccharide transport system ATP-binding protein